MFEKYIDNDSLVILIASGKKINATESAIVATGRALLKIVLETDFFAATLSSLWDLGNISSAFEISPYQRLKRIAAMAMSRLDAESRSFIDITDSAEH